MCKVQEIEGKGRGLVLTRAVESGSLLVKEQALVVLRKDKVAQSFTKYMSLDPSSRCCIPESR